MGGAGKSLGTYTIWRIASHLSGGGASCCYARRKEVGGEYLVKWPILPVHCFYRALLSADISCKGGAQIARPIAHPLSDFLLMSHRGRKGWRRWRWRRARDHGGQQLVYWYSKILQ